MGSLILGIIGALFALVGIVPLLGMMNYIAIPLLLIGLILGIIGCTKKKVTSIVGTIICLLFLLIAIIRLVMGGGIL